VDRSCLAIVIPAYNEESTIAGVVRAVVRYGVTIVVDDGSTDQTVDFAREAGAEVVSHIGNLGYDAALNTGFICADQMGCNFVITMDADGQHNPSLLSTFTEALDKHADLVVGVRDRRQRIAEHIFAWITNIFWGIRDPLCGMKAYRIELFKALGYFDSYGSVGTELMIYAARQNKKIIQIPVITADRIDAPRFGRKLQANLKILRALILCFLKKRKINYLT
jgi:glycosyltransferase involved in cell wall biosynthesis